MPRSSERTYRWGISLALFLVALLVRLPALGKFLTPDEFLWVDRSRNFLSGLVNPAYVCESLVDQAGVAQAAGLACTLRTGHPGVTTMWTGSLGLLLRYFTDGAPGPLPGYLASLSTNPLDANLIVPERLPTVLLVSLWVVVMFWLVLNLFDDQYVATAAGLLLALDPFHVALSRVIHHDALVTTFTSVSLLMALIYWVRGRSRGWLIASGLVAGLAFLSKSVGLFLNPFIMLIGLWSLVDRKVRGEDVTWRTVLSTLGDGLLWFGLAALVFVALWPAMWVIPIHTLNTVFSVGIKYASGGHAKGNFFLGNVSKDPGLFFYPVTWLLRSSPLVWLGLVLAAYTAVIARRSERIGQPSEGARSSRFKTIGLMAAYAVLFIVFMTLGEKKQDRYILPVYPILSVIAAVGLITGIPFQRLLRTGSEKANLVGSRLVLAAILVVQVVLVVANYPYYFTYFNPLLGGIRGAQRMVTIGWGEGLELAADYLNQKPDAETLQVSSWYQSTFAPFFKGEAISYSKEKGKALAGDYVVFYINQLQRGYPDDEMLAYFEARYQPEALLFIKGIDYVTIYPGPHIQHYVEDKVNENRRVYRGIAALLGWDWLQAGEANRPIVKAGEDLPFRLYWEYLGKMPEELFFFRLLDADAKIVAEGQSQPILAENGEPSTWRQGQIITEQGMLPVPPDLPAGEYRLQIGFYTQAPAVVEGELIFELPPQEDVVVVEQGT